MIEECEWKKQWYYVNKLYKYCFMRKSEDIKCFYYN